MTREEQNRKSRQAILSAAAAEFGSRGYEGASLNTALSEAGISKGRIYYYFESKDQVYLACVESCFERLMEKLDSAGKPLTLLEYFRQRWAFFDANPFYARIFIEAVSQPPKALGDKIKLIKKPFDAFNLSVFRSQLSVLKLRKGITEEDALEYFASFQEAFHRSMNLQYDPKAFEVHEQKLLKTLDMLLYGIAEEE